MSESETLEIYLYVKSIITDDYLDAHISYICSFPNKELANVCKIVDENTENIENDEDLEKLKRKIFKKIVKYIDSHVDYDEILISTNLDAEKMPVYEGINVKQLEDTDTLLKPVKKMLRRKEERVLGFNLKKLKRTGKHIKK